MRFETLKKDVLCKINKAHLIVLVVTLKRMTTNFLF